jgi:hypothetical protein
MYAINRTVAMNDNLTGQPLSVLAPRGTNSDMLVVSRNSSSAFDSQPTAQTEITNIVIVEENLEHHQESPCPLLYSPSHKCSSECGTKCAPKVVACDPCDPCSTTPAYGAWGWGWLGSIILWGIIFTVLFWLIFYSLKPPFVLQTDSNQVDTAKVLLAAVIAAIILVAIILLIKFLINRSRSNY